MLNAGPSDQVATQPPKEKPKISQFTDKENEAKHQRR